MGLAHSDGRSEHLVTMPAELSLLIGRMLTRQRERRPADLRQAFDVLASLTQERAPAFGPPASPAP